MNLSELIAKKKEAVDAGTAIRDRVYNDQSGEWRGDDEAKFDQTMADADKLTTEIDRFVQLDAQSRSLADLDKSNGRRSEPAKPGDTREQRIIRPNGDPNMEGLRSWLGAGCIGQAPTPEMRESAQRHNVNLDSKHITIKLPRVALRSNSEAGLAEWRAENQLEARAALGVGSGAIGGYTVQDEMMKSLEVSLLAFGGMRQSSTVIRTETGADLPWPTMNDTGNSGRIIGENSVMTNTDVAFGQVVFQAFKYTSDYVLVSWEFLQDSTINAAQVIGKALGERIGRITNTHFTTGDASSKPNGIVTAAGAGVTATALTATTTYDNIMELIHSVDPAYRDTGAKFMLSDAALKMLKKLKVLQYSGDTTGVPLWQPSLVAGQPNLIHGYPYVVNQSMTAPATGVKSILFGDLSKYMIRDVREITLVRAEERFVEYGQTAFLAFSRHDGDLLDSGTDPVRYHVQG